MRSACFVFVTLGLWISAVESAAPGRRRRLAPLERQFRELPIEARRLTGPLFWLHGDESKERLEMYVGKVAEGGNGCFTAETGRTAIGWGRAGIETWASASRRRRSTT